MDLAKQAKIVDGIHDTLNDFVGQRLKVRANMGRSKIVESEGVLTQVHPQLFIMEVDPSAAAPLASLTSTSTCSPAWLSCPRTASRCSRRSWTSRWSWWITRWKSVWSLKRNG